MGEVAVKAIHEYIDSLIKELDVSEAKAIEEFEFKAVNFIVKHKTSLLTIKNMLYAEDRKNRASSERQARD